MALLMEPGAEPHTESEQADLAGIAAIKEAAAREYKEQGNQFVRMGRKHYADAVDCYTKAIAQMEPVSSPDAAADASILFANRAHVNLLLGNHRRALDDAEQATRLSPSNVKAFYRAAKAALALDLLTDAASFCRRVLEQDPANEELKKLLSQVETRQSEQECQRAKVAKAITAAKSSPPLPWDENQAYTREAVELYYQAGVGKLLSKGEILHYLLEGTVDPKSLPESFFDVEDGDTGKSSAVTSPSEDSGKWIKVKEGKTLQEVLQHKDHIIPAIPEYKHVFPHCFVSPLTLIPEWTLRICMLLEARGVDCMRTLLRRGKVRLAGMACCGGASQVSQQVPGVWVAILRERRQGGLVHPYPVVCLCAPLHTYTMEEEQAVATAATMAEGTAGTGTRVEEAGRRSALKVLAAVDASEESLHALSWALDNIVRGHPDAELVIVHAQNVVDHVVYPVAGHGSIGTAYLSWTLFNSYCTLLLSALD
ncbi:hypothetical protein PR202_gb10937 [Eleusine coracana subsp. coracana]|uniref:Uncharacterized protein n=1 Tax=Eleusine coracana subsp. coracana TaxID=191504 RepID=A0AAV5EL94_ELECO|nr:hypothetical protein PR202_gb10937 [Eleusine coracana subsp. coracana]